MGFKPYFHALIDFFFERHIYVSYFDANEPTELIWLKFIFSWQPRLTKSKIF